MHNNLIVKTHPSMTLIYSESCLHPPWICLLGIYLGHEVCPFFLLYTPTVYHHVSFSPNKAQRAEHEHKHSSRERENI